MPPRAKPPAPPAKQKHDVRPGQSEELLKELHILTRDGALNQDSRRKLKQVYHLFGFIEPLLDKLHAEGRPISLVDHGAGKSYLGFILYDLWFKAHADSSKIRSSIHGIESRPELVEKSAALAARLGFERMAFHAQTVVESMTSTALPPQIDIVTALHACNTATDDAIRFALARQAKFIVLVPCCQAEVAAVLREHKQRMLAHPVAELWRHPIHTREFGSHLTNVLRCLQLEAHGYSVTVTELVGWEHSMKNELIIAEYQNRPRQAASERLSALLSEFGLESLQTRFFVGA